MRSVRWAVGAAAVAVGLVTVVPASAVASGAGAGVAAAADADEFVVAFEPASQDAALASVGAAGGTVVDVNEEAGLALVTSSDPAFLDRVQASPSVRGAAANHAVGTTRPGMPHRFAAERPAVAEGPRPAGTAPTRPVIDRLPGRARPEPLADRQWDMAAIGATPTGAWRQTTGAGVSVGIIDTGVDASHPDIAPNFDRARSRNFTMDIPEIDGPCEVPTCIDPPDVDNGGHGTHVAGIVAAARNNIGIAGVAPDATVVNVRAGQDSGYFFLYETVAALTYAADARLDVVNMSFYTDPWLFNCESADDYVEGTPTEDEIEQQAFTRSTVLAALARAHDAGVTLVAAAGNGNTNYSLPTRFDDSSPDYGAPPVERVVTSNCLDLPSEGPDVIAVSALGPSGTKSDYSNYGLGAIDVAAPGGWYRDGVGTPSFMTPGNLILAPYPLSVAQHDDPPLADEAGQPTDDFSVVSCDSRGQRCGFYTYLQGTSMAAPHVTGVVALIIGAHGRIGPDAVRSVLLATARDHACPPGGVEDYSDEGRDPALYNAVCDGTTALNGLYGEGIVSATDAVARSTVKPGRSL